MNTYSVNDECISCHACVEVAEQNFQMGDDIAFVVKQPETEQEEKQCAEAMEVCPVNAIERQNAGEQSSDTEPILAKSNVKETLDKYPQLKDVLLNFSDKFKKLLNPVMYNSLARFASFNDAAKVSGISVCEILHVLNKANGTEKQLQKLAPDCVQQPDTDLLTLSTPIEWEESPERYIYNVDSMPEIVQKVSQLKPGQNIVIIAVEEPLELVKTARGLDFLVNVEKGRDYRVSIFNPKEEEKSDWRQRKEDFEILDVRRMQTDPFDIIIQKAYATPEDEGFRLIQRFEPFPMINMLAEMGFEHESQQVGPMEVHVFFYKTPQSRQGEEGSQKTALVIQSATPVAYPVIMRMLQSDVIRKNIAIKELKVWDETEKHLAWITNGKADISFSALITSAKLVNSDIKIPALFVWDNFVILTRYRADSFEDLKGKTIHTPLFEEAPPAKITKYLMKAGGFNPEDFHFVYGKPFGRPEQIFKDFVQGRADTVILREPEASYAMKIMQDRHEEVSVLSYNDLWNAINPGFGSFPNAGIVFKGDFVRQHPQLAHTFLDELQKAISWVNENRREAAQLSFDMMRQPPDSIELFLERVNFHYVSGEELINKVKAYFAVLTKEKIVESNIDDKFLSMFKMD